MTIPPCGTPHQHWALQPSDFEYLCGNEGNGQNLVSLAHVWFNMLGDSPVDNHKPYRVCSMFYRRLSYFPDLRSMIAEFSSLANSLMQGIRIDRKAGGAEKHDMPLYRQFARTPIFREYVHYMRTGDAVTYDYIIDFLIFGKKAEIIDESLDAKALAKTLDIEVEQRGLVFKDHILEDLRRLLALSGYSPDLKDFRPHFGPGQVAEALKDKTVINKISALRFSALHAQVLAAAFYAQQGSFGAFLMIPDPDKNLEVVSEKRIKDEALYRLVPKDNGAVRSICFEPNPAMFLQEGLLECSRDALARSRLADHICLTDQSLNREVARRAAASGRFITVDLEGASDRLHWELAYAIFPEEYRELLNAVSSSEVDLSSLQPRKARAIILALSRAFPMGNALNSLIQSVSFICIVALAETLHTMGKNAVDYVTEGMSVVRRWPTMTDEYRAFGDDLTVPDSLYRNLKILLTELGFVLNVNKTFTGDQAIRESCGGFYRGRARVENGVVLLDAVEFQPLRFKVKGLINGTYDSWLGLISLANRALKKNYFNTWCAIRDLLPLGTYVDVPEDGEYGNQACALRGNTTVHPEIISIDPSGKIKRKKSAWYRYNAGLQRHERKVLTGRPENEDYLAYPEVAAFIGEYNSMRDESEFIKTNDWRARSRVPTDQRLERYYLGNWLHRPSETEGPGSPPRTGYQPPDVAEWIWTPYSTLD